MRRDKEYNLLFELEKSIFNNTYKSGNSFPSYNEASRIYRCNISKVRNTYRILKEEGLIELRTGIGFMVSHNAKEILLNLQDKRLKNCFETLVSNARPYHFTKDDIIRIINDNFDDIQN